MVCMSRNDIRSQAEIDRIILLYKRQLQSVMLGIGLKAKIFGLGTDVKAQVLGLTT